jgi:hypothetical protein
LVARLAEANPAVVLMEPANDLARAVVIVFGPAMTKLSKSIRS